MDAPNPQDDSAPGVPFGRTARVLTLGAPVCDRSLLRDAELAGLTRDVGEVGGRLNADDPRGQLTLEPIITTHWLLNACYFPGTGSVSGSTKCDDLLTDAGGLNDHLDFSAVEVGLSVDVGPLVDPLSPHLLRAHVLRRPDEGSGRRHLAG